MPQVTQVLELQAERGVEPSAFSVCSADGLGETG